MEEGSVQVVVQSVKSVQKSSFHSSSGVIKSEETTTKFLSAQKLCKSDELSLYRSKLDPKEKLTTVSGEKITKCSPVKEKSQQHENSATGIASSEVRENTSKMSNKFAQKPVSVKDNLKSGIGNQNKVDPRNETNTKKYFKQEELTNLVQKPANSSSKQDSFNKLSALQTKLSSIMRDKTKETQDSHGKDKSPNLEELCEIASGLEMKKEFKQNKNLTRTPLKTPKTGFKSKQESIKMISNFEKELKPDNKRETLKGAKQLQAVMNNDKKPGGIKAPSSYSKSKFVKDSSSYNLGSVKNIPESNSAPYKPGTLTFSFGPPLVINQRLNRNHLWDGPDKEPASNTTSKMRSVINSTTKTTKNKTHNIASDSSSKPLLESNSPTLKIIPTFSQKAQELGEKGSGFRKQTDVQDFYKIRDECLAEGRLWEDPEFAADDSSIFFSRSPPKPFEWKRPMEICDNPRLFVEGYSRFDVQQGELGDCWLLAAVANLTLQPTLFSQVVPNDQSFRDKYAGVFHFRFWQYGRWVDVVVDDRLPTCYGKLVYLHSSENNEFWSALLEKAYAKLHGSYEALKGGSTNEAMEDFTGGVTEMYDLASAPSNLFNILLKAFERNSLMGCSIEPDPSVTEMQTPDGLVKGHAYSITSVKYVDINTPNTQGKIPLLRLRNPWGNEAEWTGPWSDRSPEWRFIPESEKQEIGLVFEEDGEFWMSYRDFTKHFMRLEICNLNPDSLTEDELAASSKKRWEASVFEGEWVRGVTAGGCRNSLQTFSRNPQYRITLTDVDDEDEENKCTVIVGLMQKNRRSQRKLGRDCLTIGFAVYLLEDPDNAPTPLDTNFFTYNASVARSQSFINMREVSCRFTLPPGVYCIVPSTFEPNEEGEFLLRVFSEKKNNMEENDDEVGLKELDDRVIEPPQPEPEVKKNDEKVKEFFHKLAGDDMEVDWMELKEILDYAMRNEVSASSGGDNIVMNLLSQLCGTFFQESPLASVFDTIGKGGFSKDICRSMIAMLDADHSGKLGFDEFKQLWIDIRHWKSIYQMYSKETQGYLSAFELREALNSAGYRLNNHILNILAHRYAGKDGRISFDDFMMCAVKLKTMIEYFKDRDSDDSNKVMFTLEEWVEKTLYS